MANEESDKPTAKIYSIDGLNQIEAELEGIAAETAGIFTLNPKTGKGAISEVMLAEMLGKHLLGQIISRDDEWLIWDGKRWCPEDRAPAGALIRVAAITKEKFPGLGKTQVNKVSVLSNALKLLSKTPGFYAPTDAFDANPGLFNHQDGTFDFDLGLTRPHDPADMLTRIAPAPQQGTPEQEAMVDQFFLSTACNLPDLANYYAEALGSCLIPPKRLHKAFIWYGRGRNGKSAMQHTALEALGDYGRPASGSLFKITNGQASGHTDALAANAGYFAVFQPETSGGRLDAAALAAASGGEAFSGSRKGEKEMTYQPIHKMFMLLNDKPIIQTVGVSIKERLEMVPFKADFTEASGKADPLLVGKLLEAPGILTRRLIEAALRIKERGYRLPPCQTVEDAKRDFWLAQPSVENWFNDNFDKGDPGNSNHWTTSGPIYKQYKEALTELGGFPVNNNRFIAALDDLGVRRRRMAGIGQVCVVAVIGGGNGHGGEGVEIPF